MIIRHTKETQSYDMMEIGISNLNYNHLIWTTYDLKSF